MERIPMTEWGKDHWSVFAYIENRCVDAIGGIGRPDLRHVQCNVNRHPGLVSYSLLGSPHDGADHGIRLKDRELPGPDYDEWDCIDDMEHAGLLEHVGTGINPAYKMTPLGSEVIAALRKHKANGGNFASFTYPEAA